MCTPVVKLSLFRTYCSPLYTSQLWWNYKLSSIRKLYVAYNNGLRILLNIPRYHNGVNYSASQMFVQNDVPNCATIIQKLVHVYSFIGRLHASKNTYVDCISSGVDNDNLKLVI